MSKKRSIRNSKKAQSKQPRIRELTSEDYSQVLQELGDSVAFTDEAEGTGTVILIKPGKKQGRPIVLTESLFYSDPDDKDFYRALSKALHSEKQWATWDIFHD